MATVIDAAPPAGPDEVAAALRRLATLTRDRCRAVAVLGAMPGPDAPAELDRIGRLVVRLNVDQLVVVGQAARPMWLAAQHEGSWGSEAVFAETAEAAYDRLHGWLLADDVVLVTGAGTAGLGDRLAGD